MSGTWPPDINPSGVTLSSNQPVIRSGAASGHSQRRGVGGHQWSVKLNYPQMRQDEFEPIYAFVIRQRGSAFHITLPNKTSPRGVGTGTPLVQGAHTAGDASILIDGWTVSTSGILLAMDLLKFASHDKVYAAITGANSDGAGLATVYITPPLVEDLADNEIVDITNVQFTMALDNDIQVYRTAAPNLQRYSVDMIESYPVSGYRYTIDPETHLFVKDPETEYREVDVI